MKLRDFQKIEATHIEFKEKLEEKKAKNWLKSISAFANTSGGTIIFGVRNVDMMAVGLENVVYDSEKITEFINAHIDPLPRYEINSFQENNKDFIVVNVGDGPKTPYYLNINGKKEVYIRSGNQSIVAPKHVLDNLILKGQNITFDELPSKYTISDVSFTLLSATLKKETDKELEEKDLISFELVDKNGKVTNGGVLLSDQGLKTNSKIVCTRWNGNIKGLKNEDAIDDKEYVGSIISLLENAEAFIKNNSKKSWNIEGMKRVEYEDYPTKAIREALVNAIIHRDYQIIGAEIHVDMYDNRLEITSPGGMVDGNIIQNMDITKVASMRRNRVISDIFSRLHFMDKRGSGFIRIINCYDDFNIKPNFLSDSSSFKVILPNKGYEFDSEINENRNQKNIVDDYDYFMLQMYKKLPSTINKNTYQNILKIFEKYTYNNNFSRRDIELLLNIRKSRASEIIKLLQEYNLLEKYDVNLYKFKL